jgi:hypothetical protein
MRARRGSSARVAGRRIGFAMLAGERRQKDCQDRWEVLGLMHAFIPLLHLGVSQEDLHTKSRDPVSWTLHSVHAVTCPTCERIK